MYIVRMNRLVVCKVYYDIDIYINILHIYMYIVIYKDNLPINSISSWLQIGDKFLDTASN